MKGNDRSVNLVERAGEEKEQGAEEGGSCVWDVLYESKINLKKRKENGRRYLGYRKERGQGMK